MDRNADTRAALRLAESKTVLLETRKRDGTWVGTPVSLAVLDGRAYFRTYSSAGKAKRLRNFPEVRVGSCSFLGKPNGEAFAGQARLLGSEEAATARVVLRRRHPVLQGAAVPLAHKLMRYATLHYELTLDET
jgi:PPOX class probable F420-dependent enzyme